MQFYIDGFHPGDPELGARRGAHRDPRPRHADQVDVLVVGAGPAGLVLAAQLARFPDVTTRIIERRDEAIDIGQADGIACRTVEMFDAFGLSDRLLKEGNWVNETVFWRPDDDDRGTIVRSGRVQDTADDLSEFPHLIVNQARVHQYLLDSMSNSSAELVPDYGCELVALHTEPGTEYPVRATVRRVGGVEETIHARYVVGCDGARSTVRTEIGLALHGDAANQSWGVMDVLAVTDFPDIRFKTAIQSADAGNILIIPREGGYLVRFYIELDKLDPAERVADKNLVADDLIAAANRILHPYHLDVAEVVWWSVYEIGQRLTERFDDAAAGDDPRVFIAGDACHTHSPKAGQGMNVSMQDAFNLGWKLAAVLRGRAAPILLRTYSTERHGVAQRLIDFDREFAQMFSARPADPRRPDSTRVDPGEFQRRFEESGRYTAGVATRYAPSIITGGASGQALAAGLVVGERFHSAPVIRLTDAKPVQLGHAALADGRWRVYLFADAADPADPASRMAAMLNFLGGSERSPLTRFTPADAAPDAVFDIRAVFQQSHRELTPERLPRILLPRKGRYGLTDYEKAYTRDPHPARDVFALRSVDSDHGAVVVVRPDQYISHVLSLDDFEGLATAFDAFMLEPPADHEPAAAHTVSVDVHE